MIFNLKTKLILRKPSRTTHSSEAYAKQLIVINNLPLKSSIIDVCQDSKYISAVTVQSPLTLLKLVFLCI